MRSASWQSEVNYLVSPLEIATSWTTLIAKRTPCSTHKYVCETHTLRHLKVGVLEPTEQAGLGVGQKGVADAARNFVGPQKTW